MSMKFTFEDDDREITHYHHDGDATWEEVLMRFEEFLKGVGFIPPSPNAHLEWVDLDADFVLRDKQ